MNRQVHVLPDPEALAEAAAAHWVEKAHAAIALHERFAVALAGGSTPKTLYRHLARAPGVAWEQVWIYFSDERCVPDDHPDSNYRMARETLTERVPVGRSHPMNCAGNNMERAVENYIAALAPLQPAADLPPVLDLVLLGLGADGHTASLFPNSKALAEQTHWVAAVTDSPDYPRLTLTLPTLNAAREVMFIVSGVDKAGAVRAIFDGQGLPGARVQPQGDAHWFLDKAAAGGM